MERQSKKRPLPEGQDRWGKEWVRVRILKAEDWRRADLRQVGWVPQSSLVAHTRPQEVDSEHRGSDPIPPYAPLALRRGTSTTRRQNRHQQHSRPMEEQGLRHDELQARSVGYCMKSTNVCVSWLYQFDLTCLAPF